jgi:uncharacterized phage protein (TIGR01671 family)
MERQIKFRGYNLKNKKWIYGYYLVNRGEHFIAPDGIQPPDMTWEDFLVDSESVGQYVCTTIDGIDIYEGDVVKEYYVEGQLDNVKVGFVNFYTGVLMWYIIDEKTFKPVAHLDYTSLLAKYEVIGNIYKKKLNSKKEP